MPKTPELDGAPTEHVTRRDFVGGTLIGAGAALLSMAAPGVVRGAGDPKKLPYAILGADWTGPGGIGDYAQSNGNVHATVNAGHAVRDNFPLEDHVQIDPDPAYDLIVVGGGISGLMASYTFLKERGGKAKVLIIDNHPIFGGEAKQNELEIDGYHLYAPQGSNLFVWPPKVAEEFGFFWHPVWRELGLPMGERTDDPTWMASPTGGPEGLKVPADNYEAMMTRKTQYRQMEFFRDAHMNGAWHGVRNPWVKGYQDLPWSAEAKRQLVFLEQFVPNFPAEGFEQWLDTMTYKEYLTNVVGVTQQEIFDYLDPMIASYGTGMGCDTVSALVAKHFRGPGLELAEEIKERGNPARAISARGFPGGNAGIARTFVKRLLPDAIAGGANLRDIFYGAVNWQALDRPGQALRMRLNATAVDVAHQGTAGSTGLVKVTYIDNRTGKARRSSARSAVMAAPQQINKRVLRDAPQSLASAMDEFHHAPMLVINVGLRNWRFLERMDVAAIRWYGGGLGTFTNVRGPMATGGVQMPLEPQKPLMLTFYETFVSWSTGLTNKGIDLEAQCAAARGGLFALQYRDIESAIRTRFSETFGPYGFDQRDIAAIITNRWGHAYVAPQPGFYFGAHGGPAPRDIVRKGYGRVRFAHSELSGVQNWSNACAEGERAAKQVLELVS